MPTFNIYSIGDSAFLEQILIGIAMITGTAEMGRLVSIGLLVSAFFVCVKAVLQGGKNIEFQQVLVGWILYACMFGPSSRVVIEDVYTGAIRVVDNVPIGVGGVGGVISTLGFGITELFETGFGVISPGLTESSFADPLKLINGVRRNLGQTNMFAAMDKDLGGGFVDVRKTLKNYTKDCSLTKMDIKGPGATTATQFINDPVLDSLKFDSQTYTTQIFLSPSNYDGSTETCTDAWSAIDNRILPIVDGIGGGSVNTTEAVYSALGIEPPSANNPLAIEPLQRVENALHAVGVSSIAAQDFILSSLIEPVYEAAASEKYLDFHDENSALAINQALMQRDTQWAAEASMFLTIVRPMMTFFEAFSYAITPFMAFIIVLGQMGISLAGKYLQLQLWIQLWFPILSVTNLYIHMAATSAMSSYTLDKAKSLYALNDIGNITSHWVAVGGMLMASTPIISMVLVTGSAYAMTSLAGRMGSADHFDEKTVTPDAAKTGAVMNTQAQNLNDKYQGSFQSGSESAMNSINVGQSVTEQASNARAVASSKTQAWGKTVAQAFNEGATTSSGYQSMQEVGSSLAAAGGTGSSVADNKINSLTKDLGMQEQTMNAIRTSVAANAGFNKENLAGLSGSVSDEDSKSFSTFLSRVDSSGDSLNFSSDEKESMTRQLMTASKSTASKGFNHLVGEERSESLSKQATEAISATETATSLSSAASNIGSSTSVKANVIGAEILRDSSEGGALAMSQAAYQQSAPGGAFRQAVNDREKHYQGMGIEKNQARHAAIMSSLLDKGAADSNSEAMSNAQMGAAIFNKINGGGIAAHTNGQNPYAGADNPNMKQPDTSGVDEAYNLVSPNKYQFSNTVGNANSGVSFDGLLPMAEEGRVEQQAKENKGTVDDAYKELEKPRIQASKDRHVEQMDQNSPSFGLTLKNDAGGWAKSAGSMLSNTFQPHSNSWSIQEDRVRENMADNPVFQDMTPNQRGLFFQAATGGAQGSNEVFFDGAAQALRNDFRPGAEGQKDFEAVFNTIYKAGLESEGAYGDAGSKTLSSVVEYNRYNKTIEPERRQMRPELNPAILYPQSDVPR